MPLANLCEDVFQFILEYLEYEEIARLSRANTEVFLVCDDYVQRDAGVSVADLYYFVDACGCETAIEPHRSCETADEKIEIAENPTTWNVPANILLY